MGEMERGKEIYREFLTCIYEKVHEVRDDKIFECDSEIELGKFYYDYILHSVKDLEKPMLDAFICCLSKKENISEEKKYFYIYEKLLFKELPKVTLMNLRKQYEEVLIDKLTRVQVKYEVEIEKINRNLEEVKNKINVKARTITFTDDIFGMEEEAGNLKRSCLKLRTRKDMLRYEFTRINDEIKNEFVNDTSDVLKDVCLDKTRKFLEDYTFELDALDYLLEMMEDYIERPDGLFYRVKLHKLHLDEFNKNDGFWCEEKMNGKIETSAKSKIPHIDRLIELSKSDRESYNSQLSQLIKAHNLVDDLKDMIDKSVCLRNRKQILLDSIVLFCQKKYELFSNIIPIQIEGIFSDMLDNTVFARVSSGDKKKTDLVLKNKISALLSEKDFNIYNETVLYFMFYFNSIIRNKVAHGLYVNDNEIDKEIFANELFLDLVYLVCILMNEVETEKMYRFIQYFKTDVTKDKSQIYEKLLRTLLGSRPVSDFNNFYNLNGIQVAYWIVNPTYKKIYDKISSDKKNEKLKQIFLGKEFWEYVYDKLQSEQDGTRNIIKGDRGFKAIVKGVFNCGISSEVKSILSEVNKIL